jgi:N-methylhydantoinase B/oxoprolinase/acetone carboxylase alpha subunit
MTDPEILELRYPVLLEEFSIRAGSGGKGSQTGGDGVRRKLIFLEKMEASILSNRRLSKPFGLAGGEDGQPGRNYVERRDGRVEELTFAATTVAESGDKIVIETPGGGGFGKTLNAD